MATLSTITANTTVIGEVMTINIKKANSGYTHTIEYAFGDHNGTIATKTAKPAIAWTVPEDLLNQVPSSITGYITLYCYTYRADELLGYNYIQVQLTVPEDAKPTIKFTATETNSRVSAVSSCFVKYVSDVAYTVTATAKGGAEIASISVTNGSDKKTTATGTFEKITDAYYYVTVTDSRGMFATERFYYITWDYTRLTCNLWTESVDNAENIIYMGLDGNYFNREFYGGAANTLTIRVECVDKDGNKITKSVTPTYNGNTYSASVSFEGIDYREIYDVTAYASDKLFDVQSKTVSVAGKPLFDWNNEDFRFHIPVTMVGDYEWADFVIETGTASMGTNGTWYWRKWKSGRAECYGSRNFGSVAIGVSIWEATTHDGYRSELFDQKLPKDLFIDTPEVIDMRLKYSGKDAPLGGIVWLVGEGTTRDNWRNEEFVVPSKDNTGSFAIFHTFPSDGGYYLNASHIGFNVIGRWK